MSEKNHIMFDRLKKVIDDKGLSFKEQAAFRKVWDPNSTGDRRLYITKSNKVARIDLSKYTVDHPGIEILSEEYRKQERLGRVLARIDFTNEEDVILDAFNVALDALSGDESDSVDTDVESSDNSNESTSDNSEAVA